MMTRNATRTRSSTRRVRHKGDALVTDAVNSQATTIDNKRPLETPPTFNAADHLNDGPYPDCPELRVWRCLKHLPNRPNIYPLPFPKQETHVLHAARGFAFRVEKDHRFRVIDLHGKQVVDMMAWVIACDSTSTAHGLPLEKLNMAYTRYHLRGATPAIGDCLYTNKDRPLLTLRADTCKTHDMTFMSCNPGLYEELGRAGHRSCSSNIFEAMQEFGACDELEIRGTDPFNIFQNTPNYTLKPLNCSRPGDYVEFQASADCVVGVSCCPFDVDGFNGGIITDIGITIET